MNLPDLKKYRLIFEEKGITYPIPSIPLNKRGLLAVVPAPSTIKTGWPWTEETSPSIYESRINWPKITIVTPSYNQDQFIEETIRSVLLQNYPNLEYIIMDGGSTDKTKEILEKYSPWISYWQSEKDGGQGHAINLGFSLASGDYYAWINSDDYYLKNVFNKIIKAFLSTKTDFIYGYAYNHNKKEQTSVLIKSLPYLDYFNRIPTLLQPSCFWNAKIHQPIWEELHCSLDYELWLRLVKGNKRKLIREPLSVANVHDNAKTSDPKMSVKWEHDHQLICNENEHGYVNNWTKLLFYRSVLVILSNLYDSISSKRKNL